MNEGDVIKAFVPQADGKYKPRPVVLLKKLPYFDDWLVCGISSRIHIAQKGFDVLLTKSHPDFRETGLEHESVIRAGWLNAFPESKMEGEFGNIGTATLQTLKENIANYILGR